MSDTEDYTDFVDHFLFTEQKGYCTYFASAAAVLMRMAGVECRYVEGFLMEDNADDNDYYDVTNDMAHAWVEYRTAPGAPWVILDTVPQAVRQGPDSTYWFLRYESEYSGEQFSSAVFPDREEVPQAESMPFALPEISFPPWFKRLVPSFGRTLLVFSICVFVLFVLFYIRYTIRNLLLARSKSTVPVYSFLRKRLEGFGYMEDHCKTLHESISGLYERELKIPLSRIFLLYQMEIYGNQPSPVDKADLKRIRRFFYAKNRLLFYLYFVVR